MADILLDNQAAPSTPASGKSILWVDSTTKKLVQTDDSGVRHGMLSRNFSTASQSPATSTDVYITNSGLLIPSYGMEAGQFYRWTMAVNKTATGTTAYVMTIRLGAAQTTSDTGRVTLTATQVQTGVASSGIFIVNCLVRNVGTAGVLVGAVNVITSEAIATGFGGGVDSVAGSFDNSAVNGQFLGLSVNSQAGAWTITSAYAELVS